MIPPCKGCLLVPLCRHRAYPHLFDGCSLLREYITNQYNRTKRNEIRVEMLYIVLKPSTWKFYENGYVHDLTYP